MLFLGCNLSWEHFILLLNFFLEIFSNFIDFFSQLINCTLCNNSSLIGWGLCIFFKAVSGKDFFLWSSLSNLQLKIFLVRNNLCLKSNKFFSKSLDILLKSCLFSKSLCLLSLKSCHDGIKLGNSFFRSCDDSVRYCFSLWSIFTEFRYQNLLFSSKSNKLLSQILDKNIDSMLLFFNWTFNWSWLFLLNLNQFFLLLKKCFFFLS